MWSILRMPGQSWSVAHAFDTNQEHVHATIADTKLHSLPLWSLNLTPASTEVIRLCMCQSLLDVSEGACEDYVHVPHNFVLHAWVQMCTDTCSAYVVQYVMEGQQQQLQREGLYLWQMSIGASWRHVPRDPLPSLSCRHVADYSRLTALPPQPSWISVWTTL